VENDHVETSSFKVVYLFFFLLQRNKQATNHVLGEWNIMECVLFCDNLLKLLDADFWVGEVNLPARVRKS